MWKFAVRNLLSRPARSALSLLGLTVAIAGMIGLFSIAQGMQQTFDKTFRSIPGLIVMQAGAPIPIFSRLPAAWSEDLAKLDGVHAVAPEIWLRANVIEAEPVMAPPRLLFGVDIPSRLKLKHGIYNEAIIAGRFLSPEDRGQQHVLISRQIAEQHHKQVGDNLAINGADFTVIGIYHCGSLLLDVTILLDGDTVRQLGWFDPQAVSGIYIEPDGTVPNDEIGRRAVELLRGRSLTTSPMGSLLSLAGSGSSGLLGTLLKAMSGNGGNATNTPDKKAAAQKSNDDQAESKEGNKPSDLTDSASAETSVSPEGAIAQPKPKPKPSPVEIRNASDFGDRFNELSKDLNLFLALMTGIGMTIAVLSIINTMLMSVTERVIEFGILKANGWTPWDVLKLITMESASLGLGGGVLGSTIGWAATHAINARWPDRINLYASPGLLLFGLAFSTVVGIFGGLYPAIWAMRLSPMEAIRRG